MAKRKRRCHDDIKVVNCGYFRRADKIGLPEVDKTIEEDYPCEIVVLVPLPPPKEKNKDRISGLCDDILSFIISFLTMREGAVTSLLSPRWRNLWTASPSSTLHFTGSNLFGHEHPGKMFELKQDEFLRNERRRCRFRMNRSLQLRHFKRKGFLEIHRANFIGRANQILKLLCRGASTINTFLVSFPLGIESASHLDRWMKLAAAQGVRNLQLNFNWPDYGLSVNEAMYYKLPIQQFAASSLNYLSLKFCAIQCPPDLQGLNFLISLSLTHCSLTTHIVQTILSASPSLEFLSFRGCYAPESTALKFVGPGISLKYLDIIACWGISVIELQDVNLLSFELQPYSTSVPVRVHDRRLSIKNAPHLARLVLHLNQFWSLETLSNVPHLDTLFLKLDQQLHVDMSGLGECRSELTETKIATRPGCLHSNLKEVEIYEFKSYPEQIELAKYLLKNALALVKMKLCTTFKFYSGHGTWTLSKETTDLLPLSLDQVHTLLLKEKQASTELLIVSA